MFPETDRATQLLEAISQRIRSGLNASARSRTRCLEDALDLIEEALAFGIYRIAIVKALNAAGMTIDLEGFATALKRLRKRAKAAEPEVARSKASPRAAAITAAPALVEGNSPGATAASTSYKTRDQLTEENPTLSRADIRRLYSDQFTSAGKVVNPILAQIQNQN